MIHQKGLKIISYFKIENKDQLIQITPRLNYQKHKN